jgi:hypothetical protein
MSFFNNVLPIMCLTSDNNLFDSDVLYNLRRVFKLLEHLLIYVS